MNSGKRVDVVRNKYKENKYNMRRCINFNLLLLKKEAQARRKNGIVIRQSILMGPIFINASPFIEIVGKHFIANKISIPIV
ncbi:hypothetical protein BwiPL1_38360 [Bacillus wiedmannii]|nr:hypothetical protein BwiPL1_38360 [Bacillus wiedmannii]